MSIHFPLSAQQHNYVTHGGVHVTRHLIPTEIEASITRIVSRIDQVRGALFTSGYEYPGRYSRWDIGFTDPPLELRASGKQFECRALNARGCVLLDIIRPHLERTSELTIKSNTDSTILGTMESAEEVVFEEERTRQPSIFMLMRLFKDIFHSPEDSHLGLYGAFGYDLVFQFESLRLKHTRSDTHTDLVLYVPDEIVIVDRHIGQAYTLYYDFAFEGLTTQDMERAIANDITGTDAHIPSPQPYQPGKYGQLVEEAVHEFRAGNLFEVVPSHTLVEPYHDKPSEVFKRLNAINPSPYGFFIHLGHEHLVGSSPEMYVRVEGNRVETCPISGTIKRGISPLEDAEQIRTLLNSKKDEAELTMCSDVDRNDKSRICVPGSVNVIGRRQLEMYSHLIHTVDHIEGRLLPEFDALDAFMTHMWAVTVTGAPKRAAIQWIEDHEADARGWYGGAVGMYTFNGNLNTGLTLRTIRMSHGVAQVRVGATLLYDSIPEEEEQETLVKGAALIQAIRGTTKVKNAEQEDNLTGVGQRILFVDHEDSFVHTLASYFRQTGAEVITVRTKHAQQLLRQNNTFDLVVLSPGPGTPSDFDLHTTIQLCADRLLPIFGVCLGLQGIVEYFGGQLGVLDYPQHGKPACLSITQRTPLWDGLPSSFKIGRYHSLYAAQVPECLQATAMADDGVVMAVEHKELPIAAVQFHPESILTMSGAAGHRIVSNVMAMRRTAVQAN
ncbi:anthranilate synthase component I [Paenibacillus sp. ACRRX]|uniref:anthranilate synthase component I n=1 Tax=Paenibacillus sp. ACRRX TaxID=2918206 RepID=UPI001EF751E1|nr:anthranilate synthase component I [Paenibacillus sp. ACRRX]MCG7409941.1 anthranilate synthase component I [Paenibacillus sp. ACRRX]